MKNYGLTKRIVATLTASATFALPVHAQVKIVDLGTTTVTGQRGGGPSDPSTTGGGTTGTPERTDMPTVSNIFDFGPSEEDIKKARWLTDSRCNKTSNTNGIFGSSPAEARIVFARVALASLRSAGNSVMTANFIPAGMTTRYMTVTYDDGATESWFLRGVIPFAPNSFITIDPTPSGLTQSGSQGIKSDCPYTDRA